MNRSFRTLLACCLLSVSTAFAADSFEGKVSLALSMGRQKAQTMSYAIKGQAIRMEMTAEGQSVASIMDLNKSQMLVLMPDQQMYMVMPIKPPAETAQQAMQQGAEVKKTGRTETILGYTCEEYIAQDKGTTTEIWLAEKLGSFMGLGSGGNPLMGGGKAKPANSWEEQIKGKAGFPLRVVSKDAKGTETFRMEATKIEPGSLPASLFVPPAGYQKFAMPDMGGMNPFGK